MFRFVGFLRLLLFITVVLGVPAFVVGRIANGLFRDRTDLPVSVRILVSTVVGVGFIYTMPTVAAYALKSEEFGFLVTSGFVLTATVSFIVIGLCAVRMTLRYRIVIACVLSVAFIWSIHVSSLDGFEGEVCSATLGDHTEYAPTYSASGFRKIRVGMTAEQVQQLLGKPLDEWTPNGLGHVYWRWTRSRDGSHYYRYRVVTFLAGHVDEKSAYSYCDPLD